MRGDFASSDAAAALRATRVYDFFVKMKNFYLRRVQQIESMDQVEHFMLSCPQAVIRQWIYLHGAGETGDKPGCFLHGLIAVV